MDLDQHVKEYPSSKAHEHGVRETLELLRRLRGAGVGRGGYNLLEPFGNNFKPGQGSQPISADEAPPDLPERN